MRTTILLWLLASTAWAGLENYRPADFSQGLLERAEAGDAEAQCQLAGAYKEGRGVEKNFAEAKRWLDRSVRQGFAIAEMALAAFYLDAPESGRQAVAAEKLLLSAEKNLAPVGGPFYAKTQYFLGIVHLTPGPTYDPAKALRLLQTAADKKDACAQHVLGGLYEKGVGTEPNETLALDYLERSADAGKACGQISLAEFHLRRGNYELAKEWLEKASESGQLAAMYKLGKAQALAKEESEAEETFQQVASEPLVTSDPERNYWIGVAAMETGQFAKAQEALQNAGATNAFGARSLEPARMRRALKDDPLAQFSVEILDQDRESVGSGVWVGDGGKVLTAAHVIAEYRKLWVRDADLQIHPVSGVWVGSAAQDLAVIQTSASPRQGAILARQAPKSGDPITIVGHPATSLRVVASQGKVHQLLEDDTRMCTDAGGFFGVSGSGVFDQDLHLVGIAITSRGDPSSSPARPTQKEICIHTQAEALSSLGDLMKKSEDSSRMIPPEKIPDLKTHGKYWNRGELENLRQMGMIQVLLTGSPDEKSTAVEMLTQLAGAGNAEAQTLLGVCHQEGSGTDLDHAKAAEQFLLAASQGNSCAKHHLAMLYLEGLGLPQDDAKALEWFRKGAEDPPPCGKFYLGFYYHKKNDLVNALHWYRLAKEQGDPRAEPYLAQIRGMKPEVPQSP